MEGPQLGKEADGGVDQDDDQDGAAFGHLSKGKGQAGGDAEKNDDEAPELIVEDDREALGRAFPQAIEPEFALPPRNLDGAQPAVRLDAQPCQRPVYADGIDIPEGKRRLLISNRSRPRCAGGSCPFFFRRMLAARGRHRFLTERQFQYEGLEQREEYVALPVHYLFPYRYWMGGVRLLQ